MSVKTLIVINYNVLLPKIALNAKVRVFRKTYHFAMKY
jgi:hypothetical protein